MAEEARWAAGSISAAPDHSICPVCGSVTHQRLPAHLSPFIAGRTGLTGEAQTHFCPSCEHVYLTPFYSRNHIEAIYSGYRNDDYNAERELHEPGYLQLAPSLSDPASQGYQVRQDFYNLFLGHWRSFNGCVVDYGGGDGYFSRYVFPAAEIIIMDEDFERQGGDIDATMARADFLFATHVFEHLPQPFEVLFGLVAKLRPGIPVYLELPKAYQGRLSSAYAELERAHELGSPTPWVDIAILHEHLAHFSKTSAQTLMARAAAPCTEFYFHAANLMGFLGQKSAAEPREA